MQFLNRVSSNRADALPKRHPERTREGSPARKQRNFRPEILRGVPLRMTVRFGDSRRRCGERGGEFGRWRAGRRHGLALLLRLVAETVDVWLPTGFVDVVDVRCRE